MKRSFIIIICLVCLSAVFVLEKMHISEKKKKLEQYKVYSDVLVGMKSTNDYLVIRKSMTWGTGNQTDEQLTNLLKSRFSERISDDVIQDFLKVNKKDVILENNFNKNIKIVLLSKEEESTFEGSNFWSRFYSKYPKSGGLISLSRVGFNKDRTKALLQYVETSGDLSGSGYYILLKKQGNNWVIQQKFMNSNA
jgi:hypothetical protein